MISDRDKKGQLIFLLLVILLLLVQGFSGCFGNDDGKQTKMDFRFKTVDNKEHPDFVINGLKIGPVFILFTQNDEFCPPCMRMRPEVEKLIEKYEDQVVFFVININENEITKHFDDHIQSESITNFEEDSYYNIYDFEDMGGGSPATPTFIIITYDKNSGKKQPSFTIGYGEFEDGDATKTGLELENALKYALELYNKNS